MKIGLRRFIGLPAAGCLLLSACNGDLQERVDRLEAELREVRSDTRDQVATLSDRVESAELKVGNTAEQENLKTRLADIDHQVRQLVQAQSSTNEMAYLRPHLSGHVPLRSDHGTFLVRIEGIDLNLETDGYDVHLSIGNPFALAVQQFTLSGDFGGGVPELADGEEYSIYNKKIQDWQNSLTPFEITIQETLAPHSWTTFDLPLAAESRTDLELIRFRMRVENAHLDRQSAEGGSGNEFAHLRIGSETASVIRTEYGAFLVMLKDSKPDPNGTRLNLEIGNPYGFSISQCRLVGDFGAPVPRRVNSESAEEYASRLRDWTESLQPFEASIDSKLSAFRWNRASILVPGPLEEVKFLRCQFRIEVVTLPSASQR